MRSPAATVTETVGPANAQFGLAASVPTAPANIWIRAM
jgi:hypothetical protein